MGDTLRYAQKIDLIQMQPRGELSSTGYALANPGVEYLVLQPSDAGEPFTVALEAGTFTVEWHSLTTRATQATTTLIQKRPGDVRLTAPFVEAGPMVVYLKRLAS